MAIEFYYDLLSQPCRAVHLLLKCAGVPFKGEKVELMKGEHLTEKFLKKNPYHKVPIIKDGDNFFLSESTAILKYIATTNKVDEHWYPKSDAKKVARVDEFLSWQQSGIRKPCVEVFIATLKNSMTLGAFTKEPMDKAKVDLAKDEIARSVTHIADYFLKDKDFIAGDKVSVADILGVCELYQLHGVGLLDDVVGCNKKVDAWMKRVIKALNPHFDAAVEVVNEIRKKFDSANQSATKGKQTEAQKSKK